MHLGPQTLELSPTEYCDLLEKPLKTYLSKLVLGYLSVYVQPRNRIPLAMHFLMQ